MRRYLNAKISRFHLCGLASQSLRFVTRINNVAFGQAMHKRQAFQAFSNGDRETR